MKHLAKVLLLSLLLIPSAKAADLDLTPLDKADALTVQGHQQLERGNPSGAYESWAKAIQLYQQANHKDGIKGSLINQSLAFQQLGQYFSACTKISKALALITDYCQADERSTESLSNRPYDATDLIALQHLGTILQQLGKLDISEQVLKLAIAKAETLGDTSQRQALQLNLANTHSFQVKNAIQKFQISGEAIVQAQNVAAAREKAIKAFADYQGLNNSPYQLKAQLNWLDLYQDIDRWIQQDGDGIFEITELREQVAPKQTEILQSLLSADLAVVSPIERIYTHLKLSKLLAKQSGRISSKHPLEIAFDHAQSAQTQADDLDNFRALSFVYGQLGALYQQNNQGDLSMRAYELAAKFAQSDQAWDGLYQWRSALAQIYETQGQTPKAIASYQSAINALEQVRWNLLPVSSDLQFSFKEEVEPVYQQYMGLLLETDNPDLKLVSQVNQSLRLAELQNYLRCGETNLAPLADQNPIGEVVVQILDLADQTTVIVGDRHYSVDPVQLQIITAEITTMIQDKRFFDTTPEQYLPLAQSLYQLILAPALSQNLIPEEVPIKFQLNGPLQNIPMGFLHDGERYLIERNPIALSNGYVKTSLNSPSQPDVVVGGVSTQSPSLEETLLEPLPEVAQEVDAIQTQFPDAKLLLNQDFTHDNLLDNVARPTAKILHLSTHGQFSSDPTQTFLLAWDRPLNVQEISGVLEADGEGLDLLFLSACHSAAGDPRSLLGLAGLSAQSGARNTVASLWSADAAASVLLSKAFYADINKPRSMHERLRQAQLKLIGSDYGHPYYWANYVLVQL
ncbi:CHAT domain-containing protein [Acaryochloris marina NIES-2412]|uniref:CHAT domain-containing protein n=1 Tax=Acaryochloris marina TaxID=155978 RepID=UPI0040585999